MSDKLVEFFEGKDKHHYQLRDAQHDPEIVLQLLRLMEKEGFFYQCGRASAGPLFRYYATFFKNQAESKFIHGENLLPTIVKAAEVALYPSENNGE